MERILAAAASVGKSKGGKSCWVVLVGLWQSNGAAPPGARALLHVHTCRHRDHRWSCETCVLPNAFTRREWQSLGARTERVKLYDSSTVWGGAGGGRAGMRGSCANSLTLTPTDQLMSHEPRTGHERLLVYTGLGPAQLKFRSENSNAFSHGDQKMSTSEAPPEAGRRTPATQLQLSN